MTTITSTLLNELENKFTQHGLGYECIPYAELTYQKCVDAMNNGYLPMMEFLGSPHQLYRIEQISTTSYKCYFRPNYTYAASSSTEIMTFESGGVQ